MISATVASPRRWRMFMTCRSRRVSSSVGSRLFIAAAPMGGSGSNVCVDFLTVLIFQQRTAFVKSQFVAGVRFLPGSSFDPCLYEERGTMDQDAPGIPGVAQPIEGLDVDRLRDAIREEYQAVA